MAFNNETARGAGLIGGKRSAAKRWADKDPATVRSKKMILTVAPEEFNMMDAKAAAEGISRTELIVRAVRIYNSESANCKAQENPTPN